ncbi:MAG: galactokinase [Ginsengibacter sp.]
MSKKSEVASAFKEKFKEEPRLYYSPGRINLIGEHVDYNDGYVMPGAIDKGIFFAVAINHSETINCYSCDLNESLSVPLNEVRQMDGWKNYVLGVVKEFQKLNLDIKGFNCAFGGNIPIGGGMSSSAALEGGISFSLNELCNFQMSRKDLALLGQRAEHNYPEVNCGIMDQYANMMGKADTVLLLDCKNVMHENIPLHINGYDIILINTKVHHSLAGSAYNERRKEGEEGLSILKKELGINSFRDLDDVAKLSPFKNEMEEKVFDRCTFIIEEIQRTKNAANLLKSNDIEGFGKLMFQTHDGLKNLYEVSCKELDFLVDAARENKQVIGSRLMGGGFGGCTINIVKSESASSFVEKIIGDYKKQFGIQAESYKVKIVDGAGPIA